jgi:hypothetical protein
MRIKAFENFSLGKLGNKNKKDGSAEKETRSAKIANLEAKVKGKTKDLKKAAEQLDELKDEDVIEIPIIDVPVRPHGPAAELTLDGENSDNSGIKPDEFIGDEPVILGGEIKVAAVNLDTLATAKIAPAPAPAPAASLPVEEKKVTKLDDADSLNNLFSQDEEEENPLASLINSLPDVTVRELMDDLAEIHRIIKEWNPNAKLS